MINTRRTQTNIAAFAGNFSVGRVFSSFIAAGPDLVFTFFGVIKLFTAANWTSGHQAFYEATMRATTGEMFSRVFDLTAAAPVAGSQISTTSTSLVRLRSGVITLVDGNEYRQQIGNVPVGDGRFMGGLLIEL